jgi:hypothetical protein
VKENDTFAPSLVPEAPGPETLIEFLVPVPEPLNVTRTPARQLSEIVNERLGNVVVVVGGGRVVVVVGGCVVVVTG